MPIRANDPRPAYEQLADELRQAITSGDYQPGDKLPSTRELSESNGIALMTVRNALKVLEDENLVVARQGRGVFVAAVEAPAVGEPLEAVRGQLAETMDMLRGISDRLDRYETARDTEPGRAAVSEPAAGIDADLAKVMGNLAEVDATLAATEGNQSSRPAGPDHSPPPRQPARDADLGL